MSRAFALVVAGGVGSRFGLPFPKQFAKLEGESVVTVALRNILASDVFHSIVLAVPESHAEEVSLRLSRDAIFSRVGVTVGGRSRRETMERAIESVDSTWSFERKDTFSLIDANRPLTSPSTYRESVRLAAKYGFSCPIIRVNDGVASVDEDGNLLEKVCLTGLARYVTPESARWDKFCALPNAIRENPELLGVAEMCLEAGERLDTFPGDIFSHKLTYPEDWAALLALSRAREVL